MGHHIQPAHWLLILAIGGPVNHAPIILGGPYPSLSQCTEERRIQSAQMQVDPNWVQESYIVACRRFLGDEHP